MELVESFILWSKFKRDNFTRTYLVDYVSFPTAIWLNYKLDQDLQSIVVDALNAEERVVEPNQH